MKLYPNQINCCLGPLTQLRNRIDDGLDPRTAYAETVLAGRPPATIPRTA